MGQVRNVASNIEPSRYSWDRSSYCYYINLKFIHTVDPANIVRLIRTISLQFIVESQTWYQNDRGVMLISNQSDAKIIGLGSRVIIGLNWP